LIVLLGGKRTQRVEKWGERKGLKMKKRQHIGALTGLRGGTELLRTI